MALVRLLKELQYNGGECRIQVLAILIKKGKAISIFIACTTSHIGVISWEEIQNQERSIYEENKKRKTEEYGEEIKKKP